MIRSVCLLTATVMVAAVGASGPGNAAEPVSKFLEFSYKVTVRNLPKNARNLEVWIPAPQSDERQTISGLRVKSPVPFSQRTDPQYGNHALFFDIPTDIPDSLPIVMTFRVRRLEAGLLRTAAVTSQSSNLLKRFLQPDALVPIDGPIAREAHEIAGNLTGNRDKARALYDHVLSTMKYDKSGAGWGQGDAVFACTARRGNCSDIHSLLIGMARAEGIPARFTMGFPLPDTSTSGEIQGYHCWADLYIDGEGWIPVDASEAIKHPDKADYFFGTLDANRVAFTIGRDIPLEGNGDSTSVNYLIYPYVRLDGQPYTDVAWRFEFQVLQSESGSPGPADAKRHGSG